MKINDVIDELRKKYPGKSIVLNDKQNLSEILCEIEPTSAHPSYSIAIAVIDFTPLHYHDKTTEIYEVIKGTLHLHVKNKTYDLKEGESFTIHPGESHFAKGNETWVKVTSHPGWKKSDYHIISSF